MECKNCLKTQPNDFEFCPECGAKVIRNRLTAKNLTEDVIHRYLDIDNTLLKTFIHLITKPEVVIDGYIKGVRKKYVNPISYFALALTIAGLQIFLVRKFFPEAYDLSSITADGQEEFANTLMSSIQEYSSLITMAMIPIYALMARIVFINIKKYNYTELLVVFLYFAAEVSLISFLPFIVALFMGFTYGDISPVAMVFQIIFATYILKRLYQLSIKGIILRTLFFLLVLGVFYVILVVITAAVLYAFDMLPVPPTAN